MNKALTKADIVEAVYNDKALSFNRAEVKNIVENLLVLMKQAIKKDDTLLISGFGKFEAYDKNARKGRNPQTDESITLPPRKVVVFRLSRKFRVELNGGEEEEASRRNSLMLFRDAIRPASAGLFSCPKLFSRSREMPGLPGFAPLPSVRGFFFAL